MSITALTQQVRVLAALGERHDEILTPGPWPSSAGWPRCSSRVGGI
ncbi:hypothetical protein SALB_00664 [Streptomyces noursei]|uniref:Uncharacterized protein n=1 Tax=Streptomyces noursei TaxID=1971 RepID=A0A401QRL1_STRNR|nr:hypothetical protein SALB_00664 [Streptomyces noursei]